MADNVLIAVLTHSRPELACDAIRSIFQNTLHPFRLVVINNGGGTVIDEVLLPEIDSLRTAALKQLVYLRVSENLGLAGGYNLALQLRRSGEHFVRFNEDAVVTRSGWLSDLLVWRQNLSDAGELMHWYIELGKPMRMVPEWIEEIGNGWMRMKQATSCVILETGQALDAVGGFYSPPEHKWYSVSTEFSARVQQATGLKPYFVSTGQIQGRQASIDSCWAVHCGPVRKYRWEKDKSLCERLDGIHCGSVPLRIEP